MELPHLTMHLRRARRKGLWRTLVIFAAIGLLIGLEYLLASQRAQLPGFASQYFSGLATIGTGMAVRLTALMLGMFLVYWVIAAQMGALALDSRCTPAQWHATPLSSSAALWGILLVTASSALIPLLALYSFLFLGFLQDLEPGPLFFPSLGLGMIRLVHYSLFTGCLFLAVRHSPLVRALAPVAALTATLMVFWDITYMVPAGGFATVIEVGGVRLAADQVSWALICLGGGLLGLLGLQRWLIHICRSETTGWRQYLFGFAVLVLPLGFGVAGFIQLGSGFTALSTSGGWLQVPMHALFGNIYADVYPVADLHFADAAIDRSGPRFALYGWRLELWPAILLAGGTYLLSLMMWIRAGVQCLDAARNPGPKPPGIAPPEHRHVAQ